MNILVTGGAGYIGSHTVVELLASGFNVVIVDNFSNSSPHVLNRLERIAGRAIPFVELDLCDKSKIKQLFDKYTLDAIVHFAGLKSVSESVKKPLLYYRTNLLSTITCAKLCRLMAYINSYSVRLRQCMENLILTAQFLKSFRLKP